MQVPYAHTAAIVQATTWKYGVAAKVRLWLTTL